MHEDRTTVSGGPLEPGRGPRESSVSGVSRRYLVAGLVVFLGVLVACSFLYYRSEARAHRAEVGQQLVASAEYTSTQIGNWLKERRGDAVVLARIAVEDAPSARAAHLESVRATYGYASAALLAADGAIVEQAPPADGARHAAPLDLVREALSARDVRVGELHRLPDGTACLDFVAPGPPVAGGVPDRAVWLRVDAAVTLFPLVTHQPWPSRTGETFLVRRGEDEVLVLTPLRSDPDATLKRRIRRSGPAALASRLASVPEGAVEAVDFRGVRVLGVARRVDGTPWSVVSRMDLEEADAPARVQGLELLVGLALLVVPVAVSLRLAWRQRALEVERARVETAERLALVMRHANDAIVVVDEDLRVVEANDAAAALYGYSNDEMRALSVRDLRTEETAPAISDDLRNVLAAGGAVHETVHRRRDGTTFPVEVSSRPAEVDGRRRIFSIIRDITERKAHERQIDRLNRMYLGLSRVGEAIVRATDPAELGREVCRILVETGAFKMAWVGRPGADGFLAADASFGDAGGYLQRIRVSVDDRAEGRGPTGVAFREGRVVICNDVFGDPSLEPWWPEAERNGFRSSISIPLRTGGAVMGTLTAYAGEAGFFGDREVSLLTETAKDLSFALEVLLRDEERRRAQADLRAREEIFTAMAEQAVDSIALLDGETGAFVEFNEAAHRTLGYSREEFAGLKVTDIEAEHSPETIRLNFGTIRDGGVASFRTRHRHRNGSLRSVEVRLRGLKIHGRDFAAAVWTDITDRLAAEEELARSQEQFRQAQKMEAVGRLAGGIAHDFNNLLTVIRGCAELLGMSLPADAPGREDVEEIVRSSDRAAALTRQLLAFSRRQVLELRTLDLAAAVDETQKMLRRLIGEDVALVLGRPHGPAFVKADPGQVEQILLNLAVNARDAMPRGGRLSIEVARETLEAPRALRFDVVPPGRYVSLTVTDTGLGMDDDTLVHVFEPFFTTKRQGTGLGLATVYGIVKQSGGSLEVESAPGKGSTFRILFPEAAPEEEAAPAGVPNLRRGSETILLVEDEAGVRNLAVRLLDRHGYRVVAADGPADALAKVERISGPLDLVVTDLVMPGGNGVDLAAALVAKRPGLRVLFMSGYSHDVLTRQGLSEQGLRCLQKPFREAELLGRVREALEA